MVAAVAGAADEVLTALYPKQSATFAATLEESLAMVPGEPARTYGEIVGRWVGDAILALRANDERQYVCEWHPPRRSWACGRPHRLPMAFRSGSTLRL